MVKKIDFQNRRAIKIYETQQRKHGHTAGGKVTDSKRNLKYKFNDVQVCDISLLSAGKYSRKAESIYCLLTHRNHYFVGKMESCVGKHVQSKFE